MRVVKVGGRVQADPALPEAIASAWRAAPAALCVVHGGGDEISALQRRFGTEPVFRGGRRVTTDDDLECIRMALSGTANKRLVAQLISVGIPAIGLSGEDASLIEADPLDPAVYGRVGEPKAVQPRVLHVLLDAGYLPVISPMGRDRSRGVGLNINGDDAAAAIASALDADELLMVADVAGVRDETGVLAALAEGEATALIARGTASGGMAAKLEAGIRALRFGVGRVRIGDLAMLADPTAGTVLTPTPSLI